MYKRSANGWLKHLDFMLLDLCCIQIAYYISYAMRNGFGNPYSKELYLNIGLVLACISLLTAFFTELFSGVLKRGLYKEFILTARQAIIVELITSFYLFCTKRADEFSRFVLFVMGGLYFILSYFVRVLWKKILKKKINDSNTRSLIVVTTSDLAKDCISRIRKDTCNMFHLAGIVLLDDDGSADSIDGIQVVANTEEHVIEYVCSQWVDEAFIHLPMDMQTPQELLEAFSKMGIVIHLALAREHEATAKRQFVEKIGSFTVLTTSISSATPVQMFWKRTLDIIGGLVGCMITLILTVIIAPVIWVQSPGPIFFTQNRVGKNGKIFKMYKFRTMYLDAEERKASLMAQNRVKNGMMFKMEFDPRVIGNKVLPDGTKKTGIMELVRKFSLDEFPQFFNVLKGDMSLVGTRPPTLDEWQRYELHHHARLATKPGITGMWQVSGRSNITDFEEVVKLDTLYISQWSISMDLKILFKTFGAVLKKDGAM